MRKRLLFVHSVDKYEDGCVSLPWHQMMEWVEAMRIVPLLAVLALLPIGLCFAQSKVDKPTKPNAPAKSQSSETKAKPLNLRRTSSRHRTDRRCIPSRNAPMRRPTNQERCVSHRQELAVCMSVQS